MNSSILLGAAWGVCGAHEAAQPPGELGEVLVLFLCASPGSVYPPLHLPWGSEHLPHPAALPQELSDTGLGQGLDSGCWARPGHPHGCP